MKMLTDLYGALDPELSWLEDQPVQNEWAIDESDAPRPVGWTASNSSRFFRLV
jgi:hypothetical protein